MKIVQIEPSPYGYWKMSVSGDWAEVEKASRWCVEHQCGKKIAIRQFSFRTEADITMFRLQWETE